MLSLNISGMTCGHCSQAITKAVRALDPKAELHIDVAKGFASIISEAPDPAVIAAIEDEGYGVQQIR